MQLILNNSDFSKSECSMIHKGHEIIWNVSPFERTELSNDVYLFKQINEYWARLPEAVQDSIFKLYSDIRYILDDTVTLDQVTSELQGPIAELLDKYHDLTDVQHWADFHSDLIIPKDIHDCCTFDEGSPSTREKTYVTNDYRKLVALAIALRTMVPIWGEFIFRTKGECGTTFKEYYADRLLNYSVIKKSDAMIKLSKYVEHQLPSDQTTTGAILSGISSDDYPAFMVARVLVRRLCIGDITGSVPDTSILKFIYKFIRQKNSNSSGGSQKAGSLSNFNTNIREKFPESSDYDDGDNKLSRMEGYKIQEEMSRGDVMTIRHYFSDPYMVAKAIKPDLDLSILEISLKSVLMLQDEIIDPAQLAILQWILKPAISPRGLATLNKVTLLKAIAVSQSILWATDNKDIAALCSAYSRQTNEHCIMTVESRSRITRDLQDELRSLFPYQRKTGGRAKSAKIINPAIAGIDIVADGLSSREWILTIPSKWVSELDGNVTNKRYSAPFDLKIKLAQLVCKLAKREI